jgi:hypothetical protein
MADFTYDDVTLMKQIVDSGSFTFNGSDIEESSAKVIRLKSAIEEFLDTYQPINPRIYDIGMTNE